VAEAAGAQERDSTVASDEEECEACEADEGCEEGKTEVESEPEEPEEVEPEEAEVERLEAASDSEAEEDGAGDLVFEFDENGGRIRPEEEAAHMAEEEAEMETRGAVVEQPSASRRCRRLSRQVEILQQAAGQEHTYYTGRDAHRAAGAACSGHFYSAEVLLDVLCPRAEQRSADREARRACRARTVPCNPRRGRQP